MLIEAANLGDCRAIAKIHVASWQQAYAHFVPSEYLASLSVPAREASWQAQIQADIPRVLVARGGGGVTGFVAFGPYRDAHGPPC